MAAGFGQYAWDYSSNPVVADATRWSTSGSPTYGYYYGLNFSGSGGSLISIPAIPVQDPTTGLVIPGTSSSDYEVTSTLALNSGGGTYIHFFRAGTGTVLAGPTTCSGIYVSVEIVIPSGFTSPGPATVNFNKCVAGMISIPQRDDHGDERHDGSNYDAWAQSGPVPEQRGGRQCGGRHEYGNPGVGGYGMPAGTGYTRINHGAPRSDSAEPGDFDHDFDQRFPTAVSLKWQGVTDDAVGSGVYEYKIKRNGAALGVSPTPEFTDNTALPSTTYTYSVFALDFHVNTGTWTTVTVTTPATGAIDPKRTGIYTTLKLLGRGRRADRYAEREPEFLGAPAAAQARTGWTVPGLVYKRRTGGRMAGSTGRLGNDVGYGFGWQMLIGSITPYYQPQSWAIDHYVYTDSTGAQYLLTVNSGGVWSGTNGVYVWFDSNTDELHFRDGSFWAMGCTSGGAKRMRGTMYPTIIEDVSGNQVLVNYLAGAGLTTGNTSARIDAISDGRQPVGVPAYEFNYNMDTPVRHLSYTTDFIGTGASYSFTYNHSVALEPAFGTDPSYAGLTTTQLATVIVPTASPWQSSLTTAWGRANCCRRRSRGAGICDGLTRPILTAQAGICGR